MTIVLYGFLGSLLAGLATGLGGLGVFLVSRLQPKLEDIMLSAAGGIMLAASFFSLLLPGIEYGTAQFGSKMAAVSFVIFGVAAGAVALWAVHCCAPHEHFIAGREGPDGGRIARIWLFVIAITLHNFPEGMAVGVGFAGGDVSNGTVLATAIGIQNVPEGLAVALALVAIGYGRGRAFAVALLTGLVEPVGGLIGAALVWLVEPLMPWFLGFAAGAMLFIISHEIIPETHRRGFETHATFALMGGFVVMMFLDATLG
jgi:ZIP family zinc transporter